MPDYHALYHDECIQCQEPISFVNDEQGHWFWKHDRPPGAQWGPRGAKCIEFGTHGVACLLVATPTNQLAALVKVTEAAIAELWAEASPGASLRQAELLQGFYDKVRVMVEPKP